MCVGGCVYGWLCLLWWLSCSWTDATAGVCEEQVRLKQKGVVITLTVPSRGAEAWHGQHACDMWRTGGGFHCTSQCQEHVPGRGRQAAPPMPTCLSTNKVQVWKTKWRSQLGLGKNIHFLISCDFHLKFLKISRSISHSMYIFGGCVNMLMQMSLLLDELYSLECIVWGPAVNL